MSRLNSPEFLQAAVAQKVQGPQLALKRKLAICPEIGQVCEGFRMPAGRDLCAGGEGRRPKACKERTRGGLAGGFRLWGFEWAAAVVRGTRAGFIGGRSTIAVGSSSL